MSTPKQGADAYLHILTAVPPGKRIIQDVRKVFDNLDIVRLAKGAMVDGMGKNYGKLYQARKGKKVGGSREQMQASDDYGGATYGKFIHPNVNTCLDAMYDNSLRRNKGSTGVKLIGAKMEL